MEMFLLQMHVRAHLHHNSFLAPWYSAGSAEPAAGKAASQRGPFSLHRVFSFFELQSRIGALKWYGVRQWCNRNFRYKISSITCVRKHSHSGEPACLFPRVSGRQAGRNKFNLKISLSCWSLQGYLAGGPPFANRETKAYRRKKTSARLHSRGKFGSTSASALCSWSNFQVTFVLTMKHLTLRHSKKAEVILLARDFFSNMEQRYF